MRSHPAAHPQWSITRKFPFPPLPRGVCGYSTSAQSQVIFICMLPSQLAKHPAQERTIEHTITRAFLIQFTTKSWAFIFHRHQDENTQVFSMVLATERWFGCQADILFSVFTGLVAAAAILFSLDAGRCNDY